MWLQDDGEVWYILLLTSEWRVSLVRAVCDVRLGERKPGIRCLWLHNDGSVSHILFAASQKRISLAHSVCDFTMTDQFGTFCLWLHSEGEKASHMVLSTSKWGEISHVLFATLEWGRRGLVRAVKGKVTPPSAPLLSAFSSHLFQNPFSLKTCSADVNCFVSSPHPSILLFFWYSKTGVLANPIRLKKAFSFLTLTNWCPCQSDELKKA